MPQGFFTIEQWQGSGESDESRWMAVQHLVGRKTLSDALQALEDLDQPGFYRVVQTQRMVWVERVSGKLTLRKWHAATPDDLTRTAAAFEREAGVWPVAAARELARARRQSQLRARGRRPPDSSSRSA